jgi:eukaryotic-like serine/threonine-protein kinase
MSNQWERVAAVFEAAVVREPTERLSFVREACADDPDVRHQVETMLAEIDRPAIIDRPLGETIAELLDDESPEVVGTQLGPYRVESLLGVGGMGEVYRATDTALDRHVAIKILPTDLSADPERLARFRREAKILASLNHSNIGAIYGLETLDGKAGQTFGLVLELVEGPTLADKLKAGRLPVDEALTLARQIADALEAAHQQGIVHRDLKPGNIKVREDGTVKVLDFGLARVADAGAIEDEATTLRSPSDSPVITTPAMTAAGIILGTAAYMSPEQAKGKPADKRSDIWAFGCVVYEMLTGRRAFDGKDMTEVLGAVVRLEPNWTALASDVPQPVIMLLRSCLMKERRHRVADISTARFVLNQLVSLVALAGTTSTVAPQALRPLWRRVMVPAAAAVVAGATIGGLVWMATRPAVARITRFALSPTGEAALALDPLSRDLTILPDGTRVVYKGIGTQGALQLFVRPLDQLDPTPLVGIGNPRAPFPSPDSRWVGFIAAGTAAPEIRKVAITGGPSLILCSLDSPSSGATWGEDDNIIFATTNPSTGLQRVPSIGGTPVVLTTPDRARGESDHLWPQYLPGSQAVLFTITSTTGGTDASQVAVLDLRTGTQKVLLSGGSQAQYTPSGHLVYAAAGTLLAVAFDAERLEVRGTPTTVLSHVATLTTGTAEFDVARDGTLVYVPGGPGISPSRSLVWVDRQGREEPVKGAPERAYMQPRISPDGLRLAFQVRDQESDIWVWDLARETAARLTFDAGLDTSPVWMPDGRRIVFTSQTAGTFGSGFGRLFWRIADGTGVAEPVGHEKAIPPIMLASSVSPDGANIITSTVLGMSDVMMLTLHDGAVRSLVQTPSVERNGEVSPDGRWLAYESNAFGQFHIYVRPFPDVDSGGPWQVSTEGGTQPAWSGSGELFYLAPNGTLTSVRLERGTTWTIGIPRKVLDRAYFHLGAGAGLYAARSYDVSAGGQRFLMIKEAGSDQTVSPAGIVVVQNWIEELRRLVSTN